MVRRGLAQLLAAAVVLAVLGVLAGIGLTRASDLSSQEHNRDRLASLAGQYAVDFTSIDYSRLSAEVDATAKHATPTFATHYRAFLAALAPIFSKGQVVQTTSVVRVGMKSVTPTRAVALVLLKRVTTTAKSPAGTTTAARMQIDLSKVGGSWLVSGVAQL